MSFHYWLQTHFSYKTWNKEVEYVYWQKIVRVIFCQNVEWSSAMLIAEANTTTSSLSSLQHVVFLQHDCKDELADPELDRIGSDIEDGGLDLSLPFKPITAYIDEKREMLEQCFHVLGEKKLMKMLPDELKVIIENSGRHSHTLRLSPINRWSCCCKVSSH